MKQIKMEIYLFGSLAKRGLFIKRNINDIDILLKINKKPIKYYPKYFCNLYYKKSPILTKIYKKFILLLDLGIDLFFTSDNKHFFQLLKNGYICFWGDILQIKNKIKINETSKYI